MGNSDRQSQLGCLKYGFRFEFSFLKTENSRRLRTRNMDISQLCLTGPQRSNTHGLPVGGSLALYQVFQAVAGIHTLRLKSLGTIVSS